MLLHCLILNSIIETGAFGRRWRRRWRAGGPKNEGQVYSGHACGTKTNSSGDSLRKSSLVAGTPELRRDPLVPLLRYIHETQLSGRVAIKFIYLHIDRSDTTG